MICKLFRREDMDCKMTDIIAIISSIIAIGYSIYSIITKSYIRQYKQRFTRGYKRYKETSGLMEWKIGHIFHSIFT